MTILLTSGCGSQNTDRKNKDFHEGAKNGSP